MRIFRLVFVLLATVACVTFSVAQAAPSSLPEQARQMRPPAEVGEEDGDARATAPPTGSQLSPSTPVITIKGICETPRTGAPKPKADCETVITRAEFERIADTLQPNMPPQERKQLAAQYPQILHMSQEARKRGLEKDSHYLEMLKFAKMELLKLELERSFAEQASKIPEADIKSFYDKNVKIYDQASLLRIFVPKSRQSDVPKEGASPTEMEAARQESEALMAKLAEGLRARAAAGEDFDKLQKDAYEVAGVKSSPPPTANPKVRRNGLPASQSAVFDLKPGECSSVISEPQGFYVYKLVSETTLPLAEVKEEIRSSLRNQRLEDLRNEMQRVVSADLNKDYFGANTPAGEPSPRGGPKPSNRPRPVPPPVQPQQ
jgi:hypothetical protein